MEENKEQVHSSGYGIYVAVWLGLVALTCVTVALAGFNLALMTVTTALVIATVKSAFVTNYFMHIKSDSKVFKIFLGVCIITFLVIFSLTFMDVFYR